MTTNTMTTKLKIGNKVKVIDNTGLIRHTWHGYTGVVVDIRDQKHYPIRVIFDDVLGTEHSGPFNEDELELVNEPTVNWSW